MKLRIVRIGITYQIERYHNWFFFGYWKSLQKTNGFDAYNRIFSTPEKVKDFIRYEYQRNYEIIEEIEV
jgi:hypothetical protein